MALKPLRGTSVVLYTPATHICMGFHRLVEVIIVMDSDVAALVCMHHRNKHYHMGYSGEDLSDEIMESQDIYECASRVAATAAESFMELSAEDRAHFEVTVEES